MHPSLVVLFLALLLGIQPITTDLYLPALPAITEGFGASMVQAQLTFTALLLAFGVSQLVWGPISDRYGRRPVLIMGLVGYVAASLGSVFASSMDLLITWRAIQGVAMGAVVMCARAMTRDLYTPVDGARAMSKGLSGLGVIACMSAPLGGLLSDWWGWRAALGALTVFGLMVLCLVALRFQETLKSRNPLALQPAVLLRTWGTILSNSTFWAYALLGAAAYGVLFTFLASSAFVFVKVLGLSKTQYGFVLTGMSMTYIAGTFMCRRLLVRYGVQRTVWLGACFGCQWCTDRVGGGAADDAVHTGARGPPVLRAVGLGGAISAGGRCSLCIVGLHDDAGGVCHGCLAGHPYGRQHAAVGLWGGVLGRAVGDGGLDFGATLWRTVSSLSQPTSVWRALRPVVKLRLHC
jgi:MFS transporter, DHA1 family, multidrug resistance protein